MIIDFRCLARADPQQAAKLRDSAADVVIQHAEMAVGEVWRQLAQGGFSPAPGEIGVLQATAALKNLPSDHRNRLVSHPSFRYCLRALQRLTGDGATMDDQIKFLRSFSTVIWTELALANVAPFLIRAVLDDSGILRAGSRRRSIDFGADRACASCCIHNADSGVRVEFDDGLVVHMPLDELVNPSHPIDQATIEEHGYRVEHVRPFCGGHLSSAPRDAWLMVRMTGTNQRHDGTQFFGSDAQAYDVDADRPDIDEALNLVRRYWPEQFEELPYFTQVLVPIRASPTKHRYTAFSVSSRQGAIYVSPGPSSAVVEMILHENAHVKLREIQEIVPLLIHPFAVEPRFSVPWRPDLRPVPGIFEGMFVFSHVAEFAVRRAEAEPDSPEAARIREIGPWLERALEVICHAELTPSGVQFVGAMHEWISEILRRRKQLPAVVFRRLGNTTSAV